MDRFERFDASRGKLSGQVVGLPTHQGHGARRLGQRGTTGRGRLRRMYVSGQDLEGQRQQGVAGQDRRRLAERLVQVGRPRRRSSSSIAGRSSWTSE